MALRVAVLGGDPKRCSCRCPEGVVVRVFGGWRNSGRQAAKRLGAALRAGSVDCVVVRARWIGHAQVDTVRRLARKVGVRVVVVPRGRASLEDALERLTER